MMASQIYHTNEIKRLQRRRKAVTIVAGFKCEGGVVLCADTEETAGEDLKWSTTKVSIYDREWCQAGFGGSGFGKIADMLVERLKEDLDKGYNDLYMIRKAIRRTLLAAYDGEIKQLPYKERDKVVELLIALRPKKQQGVTLLTTHCAVDGEVHLYEVIGAGERLRHVVENLYRSDLPIGQAVLLGVHLVSLAKKYIGGVDGDTDVVILTSNGGISLERRKFSQMQERFFEQFNEALKELMLSVPDTSIRDKEVNQKLTAFAKDIKELRARYFRDIQNESLRHALSGKGQGDVYSRFPIGHTTQQGSSRSPRVGLQLSEGAQLAKALFDYADAQKKQKARPKRKSTKPTKRSAKKQT
jgi:20S proteasome alpha/beta subunit